MKRSIFCFILTHFFMSIFVPPVLRAMDGVPSQAIVDPAYEYVDDEDEDEDVPVEPVLLVSSVPPSRVPSKILSQHSQSQEEERSLVPSAPSEEDEEIDLSTMLRQLPHKSSKLEILTRWSGAAASRLSIGVMTGARQASVQVSSFLSSIPSPFASDDPSLKSLMRTNKKQEAFVHKHFHEKLLDGKLHAVSRLSLERIHHHLELTDLSAEQRKVLKDLSLLMQPETTGIDPTIRPRSYPRYLSLFTTAPDAREREYVWKTEMKEQARFFGPKAPVSYLTHGRFPDFLVRKQCVTRIMKNDPRLLPTGADLATAKKPKVMTLFSPHDLLRSLYRFNLQVSSMKASKKAAISLSVILRNEFYLASDLEKQHLHQEEREETNVYVPVQTLPVSIAREHKSIAQCLSVLFVKDGLLDAFDESTPSRVWNH